jgi:methylated-DNA-[protein]-cysteine S-methyltransferase
MKPFRLNPQDDRVRNWPALAAPKHLLTVEQEVSSRGMQTRGSKHFDMTKAGGSETVSLAYKIVESPVGKLKLVATEKSLVAILWDRDNPRRVRLSDLVGNDEHPVLLETERQLGEYFTGKRKAFSVTLNMRGTSFQRNVWQALIAIPFGETRSYGELARQLGNPRATRAVGAANGKNPISIIVPCHRLVGSTGKLTGFAGGLQAKSFLLKLEGNVAVTAMPLSGQSPSHNDQDIRRDHPRRDSSQPQQHPR